ncbi:MAG: bifunctional phosphopantothenoylcysteine decarboxylase/phosphopantothenate--cysteine ligase CoaBC [Cytophagaceae bacterium]
MLTLRGRHILVGICGSIAAYKAAYLVRLLKTQGAEVKVVMTTSASTFITPLTLGTLSGNPVIQSFQDDQDSSVWNNHVDLAMWADLMVIAPASENTIGKMANGICDNVLLATYFSAKNKVMVCPAMDLDMYQHPTTQENLNKLTSFGNIVVEAESGELASGLVGQGRLAEPEHIVNNIQNYFNQKAFLKGKKVLITNGPTYEPLDPVRFIGNHSSGKMGLAIAEQAYLLGADVTIVSGPVHATILEQSMKVATVKSVMTADQMLEEMLQQLSIHDIVVFTAAVADYRPKIKSENKIKKDSNELVVELVKNPDIAAQCATHKTTKQFFIGFALETTNEEEYAKLKMQNKKFDIIALNSLNDKGVAFGSDQNKVTLYTPTSAPKALSLMSKDHVAKAIWDEYEQRS